MEKQKGLRDKILICHVEVFLSIIDFISKIDSNLKLEIFNLLFNSTFT